MPALQAHASDLRTLSPSCHTAKALSNAPSSLRFAYVDGEGRATNPFVDLAGVLSKRCGSHAVSHSPDFGELEVDAAKGKHVVTISLPALEQGEAGASRKASMVNHGTCSLHFAVAMQPLNVPFFIRRGRVVAVL